MYPFVSNHPTTHTSYSTMPGFSGLDDKSCSRYTDSVMNSYPPMGVPGSASIAQFYQQAAAVSAASAGVGVDSLGSACSQLSSSVGGGQSGLPDITRHPWLVTAMAGKFMLIVMGKNLTQHPGARLSEDLNSK
ncbi:conserved hypothetical protein [Culex quinquefasciatus]|uniref:Uncharacterized protein n=1 Tax=Culex quinquefasciatus TaxID=7176 RepID=B0W1V3_CULQU|nr:conserved hypothetical protein [Culex quinquefasciatus]|eukprot:XP_001842687.1 conserved hypothetical protein [Culex quinquefasciatus]